jgi:hypothetical protein
MTQEELLKPRFKVIADYPESIFKIGDIKNADMILNGTTGNPIYLRSYPHLFKELKWYEHQRLENMPLYIKGMYKAIFKVDRYEGSAEGWWTPIVNDKRWVLDPTMLPATEEEYNNYTSTQDH